MVILEGVAFPLDVLNKNGWGIPSSDADNAISSLQKAVVRVCSRDAPHSCDATEDPKAEIGKVVAAWIEGNAVRTKVNITDSIANQKLIEGTWPKKWSVYGKSKAKVNGWTDGANIRSITLVTNPAWDDATFNIAASEYGENKFLFYNDFELMASVDDTMTGNDTPPAGGLSPAEFEQQLADKQKMIDDLTNENTGIVAQLASVTKERDELKTLAASLKEENSKRITTDDAKQMIAAAIAADHEAQARSAAIEKLTAARTVFGLETKPESLVNLSAADINKQAEEFGQIEISASAGQIRYQANNNANTGRLKIFDPFQRLGPNGGF